MKRARGGDASLASFIVKIDFALTGGELSRIYHSSTTTSLHSSIQISLYIHNGNHITVNEQSTLKVHPLSILLILYIRKSDCRYIRC